LNERYIPRSVDGDSASEEGGAVTCGIDRTHSLVIIARASQGSEAVISRAAIFVGDLGCTQAGYYAEDTEELHSARRCIENRN
jgi:hypothetical protein